MLRALEEIGVDIVKQVGITLPPATASEMESTASPSDSTLLTHEWSFDSSPLVEPDPLSPCEESMTPRDPAPSTE
jgi:hypothetical protein